MKSGVEKYQKVLAVELAGGRLVNRPTSWEEDRRQSKNEWQKKNGLGRGVPSTLICTPHPRVQLRNTQALCLCRCIAVIRLTKPYSPCIPPLLLLLLPSLQHSLVVDHHVPNAGEVEVLPSLSPGRAAPVSKLDHSGRLALPSCTTVRSGRTVLI